MFEGPLPLVRERDACGVGFIANVNSGGECAMKFIHDEPSNNSMIICNISSRIADLLHY